jgi:hypothetical protein
MPNGHTVWLTPLDEMVSSLERAGFVVTWLEDHSRAHRETAQALADAYAAEAQDDLVTSHRLWIEWLCEGRVRKLALVAERPRGRTGRGS